MPKLGNVVQQEFIEFNSDLTLVDFIHSLRLVQDRLPKDYENERLDPVINREEGHFWLDGFNLYYERPENEEEKSRRIEHEKYLQKQADQAKLREYMRLRKEFEGVDLPDDDDEVVEEEAALPPGVVENRWVNNIRRWNVEPPERLAQTRDGVWGALDDIPRT